MKLRLTIRRLLLAALLSSAERGLSQEKPDSNPPAPAFDTISNLEAKALGVVPKDVRWISVSADGRTHAMVGRKGSRMALFVNGVAAQVYDDILPIPQCQPNEAPKGFLTTADGQHQIFIGRRGGEFFVVADGNESKPCDRVLALLAAPVGGAYAAIVQRGESVHVSHHGAEDPVCRQVFIDTARFSPDGRRFAYYAQMPDSKPDGTAGHVVVVDGKASPRFDRAGSNAILFGEDSRRVVYVAGRTSRTPNGHPTVEERVVIDDKPGPAYPRIRSLKISGDGYKVAFITERPARADEFEKVQLRGVFDSEAARKRFPGSPLSRLIINGSEAPIYNVEDFQMSVAGRVVAFLPRGNGFCVWIDGKESLEYDQVGGIVFSPDGRRVAVSVRKGNETYVLIDGEESEGYAAVNMQSLSFDPSGRGYSFSGQTQEGRHVFIRDGQPDSEPFGGKLVRSADGKRTAFAAPTGQRSRFSVAIQNLRVDDRTYELPGAVEESGPVFSPDGSRVACVVRANPEAYPGSEMLAWVDGAVAPPLARQSKVTALEFSPDGKHFAYTATVDDRDNPKRGASSNYYQQVRVIDGKPGPMADLLYEKQEGHAIVQRAYPTTFSADGSAAYFAVHEGALHRIVVPAALLASLPTISQLGQRAHDAVARAAQTAAEQEAGRNAERQAEAARHRAAEPFQVLYEFASNHDAEVPRLLQAGADGLLYGLTGGGRFKCGVLYRIAPDGSSYEVLHTFDGSPGAGQAIQYPNSFVATEGGMIYGSTRPGSSYWDSADVRGTLFAFDPAAKRFQTLYVGRKDPQVSASPVFTQPHVAHATSDGVLYGTVGRGEAVFRFATSSGCEILHDQEPGTYTYAKAGDQVVQTLAIRGGSGNKQPQGERLFPFQGRFYSVVRDGGRFEKGAIVSMDFAGGDYRNHLEFVSGEGEGYKPDERLVFAEDGAIFGSTAEGGKDSSGTLFRLPEGSNSPEFIHHFPRDGEGAGHAMGLALGPDNTLCFSTSNDCLLALPATGGQVRLLHQISEGQLDESNGFFLRPDGLLGGTSNGGGKSMNGFVFTQRPLRTAASTAQLIGSRYEGTIPQKDGEDWKATAWLAVDPGTNQVEGWVEFPELGAKKELQGTAIRASEGMLKLKLKETKFAGTPRVHGTLLGITYLLALKESTGRLEGDWSLDSFSGTVSMRRVK